MTGTGTSAVSVNTLSNMGISATYQTVYNNKKKLYMYMKKLFKNIFQIMFVFIIYLFLNII